jgi:hypothetical protein
MNKLRKTEANHKKGIIDNINDQKDQR